MVDFVVNAHIFLIFGDLHFRHMAPNSVYFITLLGDFHHLPVFFFEKLYKSNVTLTACCLNINMIQPLAIFEGIIQVQHHIFSCNYCLILLCFNYYDSQIVE